MTAANASGLLRRYTQAGRARDVRLLVEYSGERCHAVIATFASINGRTYEVL